MNYQFWIERIDGLATISSFDVMEDGTFGEIKLTSSNRQYKAMLSMIPDAPEFYPGIPYRSYWHDPNFENFVYNCASNCQPIYSYEKNHGVWLKEFFVPVTPPDELPEDEEKPEGVVKTLYCLNVMTYSDELETEAMSKKSPDVVYAISEISVKLHETRDYFSDMTNTVAYLKQFFGAERCAVYTMDKNSGKCAMINDEGLQKEFMELFTSQMNRTPLEAAEKWEEIIGDSNFLLLENLKVIEEKDPIWYNSLLQHGIHNIILCAIHYNRRLVGFIWAANYDSEKMVLIKDTLELAAYPIGAVVANHQLVSRLQLKGTLDELTQVNNRLALNERLERSTAGELTQPEVMGIVSADLNGLKKVNDEQGHESGDRLIKRAAGILKIAFGDYEIFRAGGDEFLILCPDIEEEQLNNQVSQLRRLADNANDVSFAVGTAYCTGDYNLSEGIKAADESMYKDKELYYTEHPEMDRRKRDRE
ncbi:MAG: GGDEF domain-containing protein [Lachnospiraceae bacterium]|nr:GGDEF domain-containing protein [Lachnospiraceae bacterium]